MTTITSFNVDVSAIDNNAATTSHLLCESPTAASMLTLKKRQSTITPTKKQTSTKESRTLT